MVPTPQAPDTNPFQRSGDRHEPARVAGSRPDQRAQSAPGTPWHPPQRPADRPGDPCQSTPRPEVRESPAGAPAGQPNRVSKPRVTRTSPAVLRVQVLTRHSAHVDA